MELANLAHPLPIPRAVWGYRKRTSADGDAPRLAVSTADTIQMIAVELSARLPFAA
jgi:hypothetical protein